MANLHHAVQAEWLPARVKETGRGARDWVQSIHYTLMVSAANPTSDKPIPGIQVVVRDPRLKLGRMDGKLVRPEACNRSWRYELIPSDDTGRQYNVLWD